MKWKPTHNRDGSVSQYAIVSDPAGYSVCRCAVKGITVYLAWRGKVEIGKHEDADDAKAACEANSRA